MYKTLSLAAAALFAFAPAAMLTAAPGADRGHQDRPHESDALLSRGSRLTGN